MKKWITSIVVAIMLCASCIVCSAEETADNLTFDTFLTDLITALDGRYQTVAQVTFNKEESKAIAVESAESEWNLMSKYDTVSFNSGDEKTNQEYLRAEYMEGLKMQKDCKEKQENTDEFWKQWDEGYRKRANVLEELAHVYTTNLGNLGLTISDACVAAADEITGGFTANLTLEAYQIQALLDVYFDVYFDGKPGEGTIIILKQKQEELGLPVNGVINRDRIDELVNALVEKGQGQVIEDANKLLTEKQMGGLIFKADGTSYDDVLNPIPECE